MKKTSSFFLVRWWREMDLQKRLFVVFTILFVYSAVVISLFLNVSIERLRLNANTLTVFDQNRSVNQLYRLTKQFEVALNFYEFSSSEDAVVDLYSYSLQINDQIRVLETRLGGADFEDLQAYQANKLEMDARLVDVIQAVDQWTELYDNDPDSPELEALGIVIDDQDSLAYDVLDEMETHLENITQRGVDEMAVMTDENDRNMVSMIVIFVIGIPLFLFLAGLVTLVIHGQINQPLEQISKAAKDLLVGQYQPQQLAPLASREDEMGLMAREFVDAAGLVVQREAQLAQEASAIRAKIR